MKCSIGPYTIILERWIRYLKSTWTCTPFHRTDMQSELSASNLFPKCKGIKCKGRHDKERGETGRDVSGTKMLLLQVQREHHQLVHEKQQPHQQQPHRWSSLSCLYHFWSTLAISKSNDTFENPPDQVWRQYMHPCVPSALLCPPQIQQKRQE